MEARFGWTAIDQASIARHGRAVQELLELGSRKPSWQGKKYGENKLGFSL
jgi:hypothetical protein